MAYQAGDKILTEQYNTFLNGTSAGNYGINHIIGTGTGNLGLGQTTLVRNDDTVKTGDQVTAGQWNALFATMDNLSNHTNDTLTGSTRARSAGEIIAVVSALNSDLQTLASSVQGGCVNTTALTTSSETVSTTTGVWDTAHQATYTFTFTGGDHARWFFNAGGKLRITFANTSQNNTGLDAVVSELMSNITAFDIGATVSGVTGDLKDDSTKGDSTRPESAAGPVPGVDGRTLGYYDLTTDFKTLLDYYEASGTYRYTYAGLVSINIAAKVNAAHGDGRGNNGNIVTVRVRLENAEQPSGAPGSIGYQPRGGTLDYDGVTVKIKENSCGPTSIKFSYRHANDTEGLTESHSAYVPTIAKSEAFYVEDTSTTNTASRTTTTL